jgi:hypothetical protein
MLITKGVELLEETPGDGPPLERLLKDGEAAIGEPRNLATVLKKTLASPSV